MTVNIVINEKQYQAQEGQTVLEVARQNGVIIPTLCYHRPHTGGFLPHVYRRSR
jgi:NADP-reducing hydrogenase subunit HndD